MCIEEDYNIAEADRCLLGVPVGVPLYYVCMWIIAPRCSMNNKAEKKELYLLVLLDDKHELDTVLLLMTYGCDGDWRAI